MRTRSDEHVGELRHVRHRRRPGVAEVLEADVDRRPGLLREPDDLHERRVVLLPVGERAVPVPVPVVVVEDPHDVRLKRLGLRLEVVVRRARGPGRDRSRPAPAGTPYDDFEAKAKALQPHIVRIFYNDNWDGNRNGAFPDWEQNYASFVKVVQPRAGGRRDDQHQLPEPRQRQVDAGAGHDEVRRRARRPGSRSRPHERALGRGRERAELRRDGRGVARGVQRVRADAGRAAPRPAASATTSASWAPAWSRTQASRRGRTTSGCSGSWPTWATSSTPGASTCTGSTTTRDGSSTGSGTSGTC